MHSRLNQTKQAKIGGPDREDGGGGRLTVTTFDNNFNNKQAELMFSQKPDFEIDVPDLVNKFMGQKMLLTENQLECIEEIYRSPDDLVLHLDQIDGYLTKANILKNYSPSLRMYL